MLARLGCLRALRKGMTLMNPLETRCRMISMTPRKFEESKNVPEKKIWVSYGFDANDEKLDRFNMHLGFFILVTGVVMFGGFCWRYRPDFSLKEWAQREAYLQLRYREEHGLPLVDPNYIDPSKIILPDDSELSNDDIII